MASEPFRWTEESVEWLRNQATTCGFDLAGVAPAGGSTEAENIDAQRFADWIEAGRAGEMEYLKRRDQDGELLRSAIHLSVPWARSIVICLMNYRTEGPLSIGAAEPGEGWIARYAWSGRDAKPAQVDSGRAAYDSADAQRKPLKATDYHEVLLKRLRGLETKIQSRFGCEQPVQTRCYVDTGPMVERAAASRAGVGWIGKNTTVINQGLGSWTLLASIVTSVPVGTGQSFPAADRCGSCTRCLDACPTQALVAPRQMDASLCIAYLTIEKKGVIEEHLRSQMGRQIFGCDICQEVCPWNRKVPSVFDVEMLPRPELINPDLEWLAGMTTGEFRRWFRGSPLERTGLKRLKRNIAIAMGNSGKHRFRERLAAWADGQDEILAETARWALQRLHLVGEPEEQEKPFC